MTERYNNGNVNGINPTTLTSVSSSLGNLIITGGSLKATFNCNTIGSLFTTGGNVGINTSTPAYPLDINGIAKTSGYILKSNIPAFRIYGNTAGTSFASGNYVRNLIVDYNNGNYYTNSTGVFTAPVTGMYLTYVIFAGSGSHGFFRVNSSNLNGTIIQPNLSGTHSSNSNVIPLTAGNTLSLYCNAGTFTFSQYDSWGAILLS